MSEPNLASIPMIVAAVTKESRVHESLHLFLKGVVQLTNAASGEIYRLYLDRSKYLCQVAYDATTNEFSFPPSDSGLDASILLKSTTASSMLEKAIVTRQIVRNFADSRDVATRSQQRRAQLVAPIVRGRSCLGVLSLAADEESFLKSINLYDIEFARGLILSLFERQASLELLMASQQPIDYLKPLEEFVADILLVIAEASKMPFIQIHELEEDSALRCIGLYGFGDVDYRLFDLDSLEQSSLYASVVKHGNPVVSVRTDGSQSEALTKRPEADKVASYVITPIRVGTKMFGTLSLGAACPFDFSPLEVAGFVSVANSIGTAITNSRNAHQLRDLFIADARLGVAMTALEVAQAARHEVRGAVDDCVAKLAIINRHLKAPKEHALELERNIGEFGEQLFNIQLALDKIKNASREPDDTLRAMSVVEVWKEARALVAAKLALEHIQMKITVVGKERDVHVDMMPDSLRHAFLHLLLNSIDAFKGKRARSDRLITVSVDPRSEAAVDMKVRYADNATGIDPSLFKQWTDLDSTRDVRELIFEKGVTTKPSGSGYGLYLARMILDRHRGSIELVNYRGGVVFDITVPKNLRSRLSDKE